VAHQPVNIQNMKNQSRKGETFEITIQEVSPFKRIFFNNRKMFIAIRILTISACPGK
jgi:hypothetical protein